MRPNWALVYGVGKAVGVLVLACGLLCSCSSRAETSAVRPLPPPIELSLGEQFIVDPEQLRGADTNYFVSGRGGELWVLRQELLQPLMAARLGKGVAPSFEPISPTEWTNVDRVSVTNDRAGNPVVIMMGYVQDARDTRVVVRRRSEQTWTSSVQLDAFDGSGTFGSMVSLLDSAGRIHVAYDRRLTSRESYGIMDGHFPDKCFHAWSDGKKWYRAEATTGKGRFYVDPHFLSELPDGKVCLGTGVHPFGNFGYDTKYIGCQLWDGERWSNMLKELPKEAPASAEGQPVLDYWGNRISKLSKDGQVYCVLNRRGTDLADTVAVLSTPLVKRDRSGRVLVCSSNSSWGEVRLWSGDRWAGALAYPLGGRDRITQVLCNPDGNVFLIHEGESRIVVQPLRMTQKQQGPTSNK
ncbi:MAG: hypothetical protein ACYS8X_05460 [Planctomycetota bacterium]